MMNISHTIKGGLAALALLAAGSVFAADQKSFATPKQAVDALISAVRSRDTVALSTILGPSGDDVIHSGDPTADENAARMFLADYDRHSRLTTRDPMRVMLEVGRDNWVFPIPVVKTRSGWQFDTAMGREEILARRIGRNELSAIQACLAFVDAQRDYASADRGGGVLEYAQRFVSSDGKHDGLYWPAKAGEPQSPL